MGSDLHLLVPLWVIDCLMPHLFLLSGLAAEVCNNSKKREGRRQLCATAKVINIEVCYLIMIGFASINYLSEVYQFQESYFTETQYCKGCQCMTRHGTNVNYFFFYMTH